MPAEPEHMRKGRETISAMNQGQIFDLLCQKLRAYAKRNDTFDDFVYDTKNMGGTFGNFYGDYSTFDYKMRGKIKLSLADGRELVFKLKNVYDVLRSGCRQLSFLLAEEK